ncbi:hypothetical protein [Mycolicibacterium agri]|uniref:Lipoprotein n=1 Tax=Mycolicibacterium agri TaxID=36811 RepID=A0A7I9VTR9_MYCAG|nr:hypothetical protein [Mycolicibacterium agri]GFG48812.1 hypothetical protein MAGR_02530 [Mycolicibacterium agri]
MKSRFAIAAAVLAVGWSAAAGAAYAEPEPEPPPPAPHGAGAPPGPDGEAEPPPPGPLTSFGDGTYEVGTQILPGVYQSAGPVEGGVCYWKRVNADGIAENAMTKKPQTVAIQPGDTAFTTNECQDWQKTDAPPPPPPSAGDILGQLGPLLGVGGAPASGSGDDSSGGNQPAGSTSDGG